MAGSGLSIVILVSSLAAQAPAELPRPPAPPRPAVRLWTEERDFFHRGEDVRVFVASNTDGYLTVFRVDTDGRIQVLYPRQPWDFNGLRGGRRFEVHDPYASVPHAFTVHDYPGEGYLFAVLSLEPFAYDAYVRPVGGGRAGDRWDHRAIAPGGRVTGDPYVAFQAILDQIVPFADVPYAHAVTPYFVERVYDYPRFVCFECHYHVVYPRWNPYELTCTQFRVTAYDDPATYPARMYPGTKVVYPRTRRNAPAFVVEPRNPRREGIGTIRGASPTARADPRPVLKRRTPKRADQPKRP